MAKKSKEVEEKVVESKEVENKVVASIKAELTENGSILFSREGNANIVILSGLITYLKKMEDELWKQVASSSEAE